MANEFTPDVVYNLIASSPQGRVFVENLAKMRELEQAAKQFAPMMQQFSQNPMQAMQSIGDWAQGAVNQMATSQNQSTPQENNNSPNFMTIINEIMQKFEIAMNNLETIVIDISKQNIEITKKLENLEKNVSNDISSLKKELISKKANV